MWLFVVDGQLSFHCLSAEEIRCYIYINAQGMRFLPEDICHLLPIFFDPEFGDNKTWPQSEEAKKLVKGMEKQLRGIVICDMVTRDLPCGVLFVVFE